MVIAGAPLMGHAAALLVGSSKATLAVGDTATVSFYVDTQSKFINNGESIISFSKDIIAIKSISTQGSVFGMWVEQPTFSNAAGTITFNGGVSNPGFQGTRGLLFTATITAQKAGTASINFGESSIRANDGLGTDVLQQKTGITIAVTPAVEKPIEKPVDKPKAPELPASDQATPTQLEDFSVFKISSPSHPDESLWYSSNIVDLRWSLVKGATAIAMMLDSNPQTTALGKTEKPITSRVVKGLKDGTSYFHVQQLLGKSFSEIAHFAINVDTTAPVNTKARVYRNDNNQLIVDVSADDATSGVDYFQVFIDNTEVGKIPAKNGVAQLILPSATTIGNHILEINTYDFARNKQNSIIPITVEAFLPPVITVDVKNILIGNVMTITGEKAGIQQLMNIFVRTPEQKIETYQVSTGAEGMFRIKNLVTTQGVYEVWVEPLGDMKDSMKPMVREKVIVPQSIFYHIYKVIDIASPIIMLVFLIGMLVMLRKQK